MDYTPEVFIRTNNKRPYEFFLTQKAICQQKGVEHYMTIYDQPLFDNVLACEKMATPGQIYIVCDDDIIPSHTDTLRVLVEELEARPDFGIMGLAWKPALHNDEIRGWTAQNVASTIDPTVVDENLVEVDHVGGIYAIRQGFLKDDGQRPNLVIGIGDDRLVSGQIRAAGLKVGLFKKRWFNHIGDGKSTVWTT